MRARTVKHLQPKGGLADNLARIVAVRVDEVYGFAPKAIKPGKVTAQHNMRIAIKRLRYVLELGDGCFGPYARTAIGRTRELQDALGEIHDCDIALPRVRARLQEVAHDDVLAVLALAGGAPDLDPALASGAPHAAARRGLVTLSVHLHARRELLFERFLTLWERTERDDFRGRLLAAIDERPVVLTSASHDADTDAVQQADA